jgi:hypothetical protein
MRMPLRPQDRQVGVNNGERFSSSGLTLIMNWNVLVSVDLHGSSNSLCLPILIGKLASQCTRLEDESMCPFLFVIKH